MQDYPLKSLKLKNSLKIFIVFALLFIAGCAGEAGRVELPLNHPANPQAQESGFRPPQNSFQTDAAAMEEGSTKDSTMKHKIPQKSIEQIKSHKMGPKKESQFESESTKKPDHRKDDNLHKEHSQ